MITSRSNKRIVSIRKLRARKERELAGLFFLEGIRIVGEAVQLGAEVETLVVAPDLLRSEFGWELVEGQRRRGVACLEVSGDVFESLSVKERPQGLGAVVRQGWTTLDQAAQGGAARPGVGPRDCGAGDADGPETGSAASPAPLWVALSEVADPGNLGTILRTCDAVGAAGIILVGDTTDPYDPACVRASMGAVFSQRLVRTCLGELAAWAERNSYTVVGTSAEGARHYREAPYGRRTVLFMGSERQGLSGDERAICHVTVRIPMVGRADSLNLAVATAVILYEIFNRRHGR